VVHFREQSVRGSVASLTLQAVRPSAATEQPSAATPPYQSPRTSQEEPVPGADEAPSDHPPVVSDGLSVLPAGTEAVTEEAETAGVPASSSVKKLSVVAVVAEVAPETGEPVDPADPALATEGVEDEQQPEEEGVKKPAKVIEPAPVVETAVRITF